ncbi:MAG: hypothetical protein QM589_04785 [Thermomicrobiales bacterium]
MSRKRGRPQRHYRIRVRTVRRDPIDYEALAQAALEQAAMDQRRVDETTMVPPRVQRDNDQSDRDGAEGAAS